MEQNNAYQRGFIPYALAAFLIGLVGGFSAVLGPAFVQDIGIAYNNTTWTALAQAMSTAACAPILGKIGDVIGRRTTLLLGIARSGSKGFLPLYADFQRVRYFWSYAGRLDHRGLQLARHGVGMCCHLRRYLRRLPCNF